MVIFRSPGSSLVPGMRSQPAHGALGMLGPMCYGSVDNYPISGSWWSSCSLWASVWLEHCCWVPDLIGTLDQYLLTSPVLVIGDSANCLGRNLWSPPLAPQWPVFGDALSQL
jgi:hypothetical protein